MQLVLIKGWDGTEELISDQPNKNIIDRAVRALDWNHFNAVSLKIDDENWLNVSGSISDDGLAIVVSKNDDINVSDTPPETIDEIITILNSYLADDQNYKKYGFSPAIYSDLKQKQKEIEIWKEVYEIQRKQDRRKHIVSFVASAIIISVISITLYLWYIDELKFIGHQTGFTTAFVTETKMKAVRGGFIQIVFYEFELEGIKYTGRFNGSKFTGKHEVEDLVRIKYSTKDPSISKRVSTLKRKY